MPWATLNGARTNRRWARHAAGLSRSQALMALCGGTLNARAARRSTCSWLVPAELHEPLAAPPSCTSASSFPGLREAGAGKRHTAKMHANAHIFFQGPAPTGRPLSAAHIVGSLASLGRGRADTRR